MLGGGEGGEEKFANQIRGVLFNERRASALAVYLTSRESGHRRRHSSQFKAIADAATARDHPIMFTMTMQGSLVDKQLDIPWLSYLIIILFQVEEEAANVKSCPCALATKNSAPNPDSV